MKIFYHLILLICLFTTLIIANCSNSDRQKRIIKIGIYTNASFRRLYNWQEIVLKQIASTSAIYDSAFGIRFVPISYSNWEISDSGIDTKELLTLLERYSQADMADIIIGYTFRPPGDYEQQADADLVVGKGRILGRTVCLRYEMTDILNSEYLKFTLAHEIAHLFGAFHVDDSIKLMRSYSDGVVPQMVFDTCNKELIRNMKYYDFGKGVYSLTNSERAKIQMIYARRHAPGEQNPVAAAFIDLGMTYLSEPNMDSVRFAFGQALPYLDTSCTENLLLKSFVLQTVGDTDLAGQILNRLRNIDHLDARTLSNIGTIYLVRNKLIVAIEMFDRSLIMQPRYVNGLFGKALALLALGDTVQAMVFINSTLSVDPSHPKAIETKNEILEKMRVPN